MLMEVLPRFGKHAVMAGLDARFGHDEVDIDSWEANFLWRADAFNEFVRLQCKKTPYVSFAKIGGFKDDIRARMPDGLHLDSEGYFHLAKSIKRGACIVLDKIR